MKESPRDPHWENDVGNGTEYQELTAEISSEPTEAQLVTIALLMRLYDLNLALLNHFDSDLADNIYETHEKGGHKNPPIYIPRPVGEDETNQS